MVAFGSAFPWGSVTVPTIVARFSCAPAMAQNQISASASGDIRRIILLMFGCITSPLVDGLLVMRLRPRHARGRSAHGSSHIPATENPLERSPSWERRHGCLRSQDGLRSHGSLISVRITSQRQRGKTNALLLRLAWQQLVQNLGPHAFFPCVYLRIARGSYTRDLQKTRS